ncbi:MAG: hypothetical protein JXA42_22505, partial [Anaerolineales bacterium]|nr:hypothetical protein [Anaerolineales bacterium]
MNNIIRTFQSLTGDEISFAGGKGGGLARLAQADLPVPDGFVILPAAFDSDELTAGAWAQVQARLQQLRRQEDDVSFAVRSSAMSEDSAAASFAGEFETVLNVRTDQEIRQAIDRVYRSRSSERVRAYSQARGLDVVEQQIAV